MRPLRKPFRYAFFNATLIIILLNVAVFFLLRMFPYLYNYLGLSLIGVLRYHYYWQIVTYLFVHDGVSHILFNMLALLFFGIGVERAMGSKEFLLFYFVCGILDGIFSVLIYIMLGWQVFLVGASGAIYAVLFAYAVLFPRNRVYIWGVLPVRAPILVAGYAVIEFVSQIYGGGGVAHIAHLMGFVFAWLYFVIRMGIHPLKVWIDSFRSGR